MELKKINLVSMRLSNKETVLAMIRRHDSISRAEIAHRLNISKSAVSSIVNELIQDGVVCETQVVESTSVGGRRPIGLGIVPTGRYSLGIEITATRTVVMLVDLMGNIVANRSLDFAVAGMEALNGVLDHVEEFIAESSIDPSKIVGVGIGVPGTVNYHTGEISSPLLQIENEDVRSAFSHILPGEGGIIVDNDANMAVVGERWKGNGIDYNNMVLISIGLGIGAGLILNGEVYRGANNSAGEIGYFEINPYVFQTGRSLSELGSLEDIASEKGIVPRMKALLTPSGGTDIGHSNLTYEQVIRAARNGNEEAKKLVDEAILVIAFAIAQIVSLLNPEVVLIAGVMSGFGGEYIARIRARVSQLTPISTDIVASSLGEDATALGGAASALIHAGLLQLGGNAK